MSAHYSFSTERQTDTTTQLTSLLSISVLQNWSGAILSREALFNSDSDTYWGPFEINAVVVASRKPKAVREKSFII